MPKNAACHSFVFHQPQSLRLALLSGARQIIERGPDERRFEIPEIYDRDRYHLYIQLHSAFNQQVAADLCHHISTIFPRIYIDTLSSLQAALHEALLDCIAHHLFPDAQYEARHTYQTISEALNRPIHCHRKIKISYWFRSENQLVVLFDSAMHGEINHAPNKRPDQTHALSDQRPGARRTSTLLAALCQKHRYSQDGRRIILWFDLTPPDMPGAPQEQTYQRPYRLLLIDDSQVNRMMLRNLLMRHGFSHISEAENGREGLELTRQTAHQPFDLILSDWMMPEMTGIELCRQARQIPELASTPIMILTGMVESEQRAEAFAAGASDLMYQPFHAKELLARIELHLERAKAHRELRDFRSHLQGEIEQARYMHQLLLPSREALQSLPQSHGMCLSHFFVPSHEIGGDIWGAFPLSEQRLGIYICDFTGHGVGAAINTFRLHTALASFAESQNDPGTFLTRLNRFLYKMLDVSMFATFFYAVVDAPRNQIQYAAAGSPQPYIYRHAHNKIDIIDSSGVPLGICADAHYTTLQCPFELHDSMLLYSDALLHSLSPDECNALSDTYLEANMPHYLQPPLEKGQQLLLHSILDKLHILEGASMHDDLTLVLLSRLQ